MSVPSAHRMTTRPPRRVAITAPPLPPRRRRPAGPGDTLGSNRAQEPTREVVRPLLREDAGVAPMRDPACTSERERARRRRVQRRSHHPGNAEQIARSGRDVAGEPDLFRSVDE